MRDDFQIWVDAVCEQVRFWPDRKEIAKELRVHYEDHRNALEQLHYEPELAAERSLRAMGNAQEMGWALDRVHKPWLGWLWESSRWPARGMAALLVITMLCSVDWGLLIRCTWDELAWEEPPAGTACVELEHGTLWAAQRAGQAYDDAHLQPLLKKQRCVGAWRLDSLAEDGGAGAGRTTPVGGDLLSPLRQRLGSTGGMGGGAMRLTRGQRTVRNLLLSVLLGVLLYILL